MAVTTTTSAIYVELDCLLDTRLGTLARLGQDKAINVLNSKKYTTRRDDFFDDIDNTAYKELYDKRDTVTLAHSIVTPLVGLIKSLIPQLLEQSISEPYQKDIKLVINSYPYDLSEEEKKGIGQCIYILLGGLIPIEITYIHPNNLTPKYCKSEYVTMFMYEYTSWLELHAKEFEKTRLPEVTLFGPAIYFLKAPDEEAVKQMVKDTMHPLHAIEMFAGPMVDLKLIDVSFFSIPTT